MPQVGKQDRGSGLVMRFVVSYSASYSQTLLFSNIRPFTKSAENSVYIPGGWGSSLMVQKLRKTITGIVATLMKLPKHVRQST